MALADFNPETRDIEYRGKILATVRGLNGNDCALLVRGHLDDLQVVFRLVAGMSRDEKLLPSAPEIENMVFRVVTELPNFTARVIALACGEPAEEDKAKLIPMPLQITIAIEVIKLTFEDVGGPLAFAGMIRGLALSALSERGLSPAIPSLISSALSGNA